MAARFLMIPLFVLSLGTASAAPPLAPQEQVALSLEATETAIDSPLAVPPAAFDPPAVVDSVPALELPTEILPTEIVLPEIVLPEPIDLTAPTDDLWVRVRRGFAMPELRDELVERNMRWYLSKPDYLRRMVDRSRLYLHYIVEELERRGMPTELALLPMVESAFNPMAYSSARASGLWQFIPSTGKLYQLDQNWWIDERRDVVSSTNAALSYLRRIYDMHGDWHLALASYNWGEGAVGRAIAKNRAKGLPTDYLSLRMPPETRNYVPKLQALKNILANPELVALLDLPPVPNEPYFATIEKPAAIDVKLAARLAEIPLSEFIALNPAHNRPVIRSDVPLLLPADKIDVFLRNVDAHDGPLSSWKTYVFQRKDRLDKVAARHGMTLAQIKAVNGLRGRRARAVPGQQLLVPVAGAATRENLAVIQHIPSPPAIEKRVVKGKRYAKGKRGKVRKAVYTKGNRATAKKLSNATVRKKVRVSDAQRRKNRS